MVPHPGLPHIYMYGTVSWATSCESGTQDDPLLTPCANQAQDDPLLIPCRVAELVFPNASIPCLSRYLGPG